VNARQNENGQVEEKMGGKKKRKPYPTTRGGERKGGKKGPIMPAV